MKLFKFLYKYIIQSFMAYTNTITTILKDDFLIIVFVIS